MGRMGLAGMLLVSALAAGGESRLAVIQKAPGFELLDQTGAKVRLEQLPEEVLLVSFIFTTCNGTCPATTHRMTKVQEELKQRGLLKTGKVRLLSITLDPERDTPAVLKNYMQLYEIEPAYWGFLTGNAPDVHKVVEAWGMWARPAANGQLDHPSRIFLVDAKRNVREIYNLAFMKTGWVADDVELLLTGK